MIITAAIGAGSHGDHPAGLWHLVIDLAQGRGHLVGQRAGHDHDVGLARAWAEQKTKAVHVIARCCRMHHLDRTTGQPKGHRPKRSGPGPVDQLVHIGDDEALVGQARRSTA